MEYCSTSINAKIYLYILILKMSSTQCEVKKKKTRGKAIYTVRVLFSFKQNIRWCVKEKTYKDTF